MTVSAPRRAPVARIAGLVLLAAAATPAAVGPAAAATASGIGAHTCGDYLHAVDRGQKIAIDSYVSWTQGFISAYNWLNTEHHDVAVDAGALTYWLIDYCSGTRGSSFFSAVQELIRRNTR